MGSAEAAILSRMLKPERDDLSPEATRSFLKLVSINNPDAIAVREALIEEGVFPGRWEDPHRG